MSFTSPLERLADKFNIISFNTRELISKLSAWSISDEDSIQVMLKVEDAPFFETYKIPTLKYIKNNSIISNWTNNRPVGVKYWGTELLSSKYLTTGFKYRLKLNTSNYPLNHYFEYNGSDVEGNLTIDLDEGQFEGDIISFVIKVSSNVNNKVIYVNDGINNTTLIKLGRSHLVNVVEYSPSLSSTRPNTYKVSFQCVNDPYIGKCWKIFDLYELPSAEYVDGDTRLKTTIFKDPFVQ